MARVTRQEKEQVLARVNARDKHGRTALHWAAEKKDNKYVVCLLVQSGANVNMYDSEERVALPQAAALLEWGVINQRKELVHYLLNQGVDGVKGGADYGQKALGFARENANLVMVDLLISEGVNTGNANERRRQGAGSSDKERGRTLG
jgi:ankyrin repeat protein